MNPDAKVKMRGVQVGKVSSIDAQPDGTAAIRADVANYTNQQPEVIIGEVAGGS